MEAITPHCVAAAGILRRQFEAHIIMVVADGRTYYDKAFGNRIVVIDQGRVGIVMDDTADVVAE
jgi:hypothetical protein